MPTSRPPSQTAPTLPPGKRVRFGNCELIALVGRGGMASVYQARELEGPRKGWTVALKRLLPEFMKESHYVEHFLAEAALCRQLSHPNIITVYDAGEVDGIHYMTMDYLDGRDLAQVVRRCTELGISLPVDFAVFLARVLVAALEGAHTAVGADGRPLNIVHCDVSPSNLFISRTGEIKLGDFGIARSATAGQTTGLVAGKPYYVSPEVLDGRVTPEADLWAATATLYEMLTLAKPFQGTSPNAVFDSIVRNRYQPVRDRRPDVPKPVADLVARAFSSDPRKRFPTAAEYGRALDGLFDERVGTPLAIAAVVRGLFGA